MTAFGYVADNVTHSGVVNNQVGNWLGYSSAASPNCFPPLPPTPPTPPASPIPRPRPPSPPRLGPNPNLTLAQGSAQSSTQTSASGVQPRLTPERIEAELPADAVRLGQPATIRVILQGGKMLVLGLEQREPVSHRAMVNEIGRVSVLRTVYVAIESRHSRWRA